MTTPPTPADWYPDPDDAAGLRYWDGTAWTEHRAPAVTAPSQPEPSATEGHAPQPDEYSPTDQATSAIGLPDQSTSVFRTGPATDPSPGEQPHGGAHRAPDPGREPVAGSYTPTPSQPYDTHPPTAYQPPSDEPPSWDAPSWDAPPPGQSYAPPQSSDPALFAPPPGPSGFSPPVGPSGDGPNKKLVVGILGGAAAILLALVLVFVFVVMRKDEPTVTSSPTTSPSEATTSSSEATTSTTESESPATESPTPPPSDPQGSDGDYTFSVAGTETGDTITSTVSDSVQTTADGIFYVVYVNVGNTGTSPLTFVATFQALSAAGQTFALDDEATAFLGGTIADVAPGDQVETPLVYDVPMGTEPDSILLRADPVSPGVQLPLG